MKLQMLLAAALFTPPLFAQTSPAQRDVYAFFTSWSVYARDYHIPDVPAQRITHLIYAFARVENGVIALGDPYADIDKWYPGDSWAVGALRGSFHQMQVLKANHSHLRTLISLGGAGASQGFTSAVATAAQRQVFATSVVDFLVTYDFDGVDVDWEFPGVGGSPQDPANYLLFLAELRTQLDARGVALGREFALTVDVPADPAKAALLDLPGIAAVTDALLLTSFDYFVPIAGLAYPVSHFIAPLHPVPGDPTPAPYSTEFNIEATLEMYRQAGVPASKTVLGMAFYGRGYEGISGGTNGLFASYTGPASFGTWEPGVFDYTDLASSYIGLNGYARYWDDAARAPRLYNPTSQVMISYEDVRSIREKAWYLNAKGLAGAMIWELSCDRAAVLLSEVERVVMREPRLAAAPEAMSVLAPANIAVTLDAGAASPGRLYILLGSLSGTYPGFALPGGVWPVNLDAFAVMMLGSLNTPLFPGGFGFTDPQGGAQAGVQLSLLPYLPPSLIGQRLALSAWVFADAAGSFPGTPSSACEVLFQL